MSGFDGKNLIGGEWRAAVSGRTFEQRNPAFLHEVTGTFADSGRASRAEHGWASAESLHTSVPRA